MAPWFGVGGLAFWEASPISLRLSPNREIAMNGLSANQCTTKDMGVTNEKILLQLLQSFPMFRINDIKNLFGCDFSHLLLAFTFRAFSRRFCPKRLT